MKSCLLFGSFNGQEVIVHGGWQHPETGCHLEISGEDIPRQSVPAWDLVYPDLETAEEIFTNHFGIDTATATIKDERKGVYSLLRLNDAIPLEKVPERKLASMENNPECLVCLQEALSEACQKKLRPSLGLTG
ncbi:MAG: hypothetical protein WC456_00560 [Patescibacteria group bacterium]